jgi:hypothetical protein
MGARTGQPSTPSQREAGLPGAGLGREGHRRHPLTRAAKDEAYRAVVVQTRYVRGPSTTLVVLGGVVLVGLAVGAVILARRRQQRR